MVSQMYPSELQLNEAAYTSDIKAWFFDLHLSFSNGIVSTKIYDKRDTFDFEIVNFHFWIVMFLAVLSISQLIRFDRASSHVADFNTHNKLLTQKFLIHGY